MNDQPKSNRQLGSLTIILLILIVFYPMSLAGIGECSNGGAVGLGLLLLADYLAWKAVILNKDHVWFRRLVQMPVVIITTFALIHEVVCQYCAGDWLWF